MGKIRSTDEPVGRMAKLMAELHYFMAKEMIDRLGEEKGKEAVRAAITKFGEARAEVMLEEAKEKGLEINAETFSKIKDMPSISWEKDPENPCDMTYCPMHDMWEQLEAEDIGALYCEIDDVLYNKFNLNFERPLCKTNGDKCCRFIVKDRK
ncbi:L-2-amino-thiazoline-4-carboxylic acid hydrolase [Clostridium sp. JS66]|uniref:L-2-amino-thiazoline-4-carboxylic acid hydrolase n=1 Tax=Clostridium sp. JS66 TaxID=3064705 RepID=UPI00298DCE7E|nr:L-2-amino-thiazoline-4-carboxylic acid hydrolase [Clostridium sp. JS66]WPC39264.1 L-2-amino-thiazoline-4-carboxylic acid hydrolase [Clostridium sp. JS66]